MTTDSCPNCGRPADDPAAPGDSCDVCGAASDGQETLDRCFMGYDPAEQHEDERFYVMRMLELTIYGHTVDHWTKRDYPEDWPMTERGRREGREFACWHSNACPDGEIGSNPIDSIQEITYEAFEEARGNNWPYLPDQPVTTYAPVSAVGYIDDNGEVVQTWDSLRGDLLACPMPGCTFTGTVDEMDVHMGSKGSVGTHG